MRQYYKKMAGQLVVWVSIFSLVFSCSSLRGTSTLMLYYEKLFHYLQLLNMAMNKNCIFLVCNGILVILAKTSAFVPSPSALDLNDMLQKSIGDGLLVETADSQPLSNEEKEEDDDEEEEEDDDDEEEEEEDDDDDDDENDDESSDHKEDEQQFECVNEKGEDVSISIAVTSDYDDVEEDKLEDEEEEEKLSTEELNQKFEDFIRRMKEEFRINDAQQPLLMVVK